MLKFLPFKSKSFISLNSCVVICRILQRAISVLQQKRNLASGYEHWCINNFSHREEKDENNYILPIIIYSTGSKIWMRNGKCHRDERERRDSSKQDRCESGLTLPACIYSSGGYKAWYKNDKRHRNDKDENGRVLPAVVWNNKYKEWWLNGNPQFSCLE